MAKITLENGFEIEGTPEELITTIEKLSELAGIDIGGVKKSTEEVSIAEKYGETLSDKIKVGDYVKVVGPTVFDDIKEGAVAKIIRPIDRDGDYKIELLDESDYDYAKPDNLEKVEITSRELSFFNAGRELNEFEIGDIVRVLYSPSAHPKQSIIEISGFIEDGTILAKGYEDVVDSVSEYMYKAEDIELIAPVDSRVDTVE